MRAKEWLLDNGHIEAVSRGRISGANHERLRAAVASGVKFSDYAVEVKDGEVTSRTVTAEKHIPDVPPDIWPVESTMVFADFSDGRGYVKTKANTRASCFNCPGSLSHCNCGSPRAIVDNEHGYVPVRLEVG